MLRSVKQDIHQVWLKLESGTKDVDQETIIEHYTIILHNCCLAAAEHFC